MNLKGFTIMLDAGFYNLDCMQGMAQFPDKFFSLAIVDPPYGMNALDGSWAKGKYGINRTQNWDCARPTRRYFDELFRVSTNQIVWGGNYFISSLRDTKTMVVWDKQIADGMSFSMIEVAWTSFGGPSKLYTSTSTQLNRIHPTQKPIALYKWLLHNYAKPGDKILDTHVGSASSLIACHQMGFEYWGFELDADYYRAATERLDKAKAQVDIFEACELPKPEQVSMINSYQKLP